MAIIKQYDKRSGITYVYESKSYWDKEKQQPRSQRKLIGKIDPETGEVIPTDGRGHKRNDKNASEQTANKPCSVQATTSRHMFYGATYLLEMFSDELGLTEDLHACFPDTYKQILSIAFYLIMEDSSPLYRFEKWHLTHKHPYGEDITSPRSSELFSSITDDQVKTFFRMQGKRRIKEEYWAYDSTSISSYSETLKQVQLGKNKEDDKLPQLNLLLVFGEKSGLPFYYRKLAGNIPDSKTVKHLLQELDILCFNGARFVMDRGFYSEKNINSLMKEHVKFLIGVKISLSFVKSRLDTIYDDIRMFQNYDEATNTYGYLFPTEWEYRQERPYKQDVIKEKRRVYLQFFYNIEKGAEDEAAFDKKIATLRSELLEGQQVEGHQKEYRSYFDVKKTPKRGITVTVKEDAVREARKYFGYFALLTNQKMDAFTALYIYRMKDVVEKAFGNLKERLNMRRLLVSSEKSLDGKIFVEFVALILISYLNRKMQDAELFKKYSLHQLLDKLDVIECFQNPGYSLCVGEILKQQEDIFKAI